MLTSYEELDELIETLGKIRGRHTELVTVMIPSGANIYTTADQIASEGSTADNIKSKTTRKNVVDALEMISRELKKYKQTPANGMAIFCGNVSEKEGQNDLKLWVIEPPQSLRTRLYRCDQVFVIQPLQEMREVQEVYGLLVMDRKEATIGVLEGKQIRMIRKMSSGVPGKIRAGGQSAARFERITEGLAKEFFRRVSESMKEIFFDMPKLKGILVGGPVPTKEEFLEQGQLVTKLKELVIGVRDIGNTDESGLTDLVEASNDILANQEIIKEKKLLEKFFETLGKKPDLAAYGEENVKKALKYGAVSLLLLSKKLKKEEIKELRGMADSISADSEIISTETPEGEQFWNLSGIGALLRFATG
ncbi:MAG: peptide chain release factor aRF-1 [Nanoarchaeota archaeon]|nr:peptide chain release factor aRF-1 [Nanoarchaeota archaeon]